MASVMAVLQKIQVLLPRCLVPSGAVPSPVRTSKRTVLAVRSTTGSTQAFLPGLVESQNERTRGIRAPQAGLGQITVRAHSQAMTVASPPPCSFGSLTFG